MNHPGRLLLLPSHLEIIRESLTLWKRAHPKAIAGWCECRDCYSWGKGNKYIHEELDDILARLIWLEFWTDWALKN